MNRERLRPAASLSGRIARSGLALWILLCAGTSACVTQNEKTGEMVPRGQQRYPWDEVVERAKNLQNGMQMGHVQLIMGSPAEKDDAGNTWIYLPERYAILIPAEALRLEFENNVLVDFGYRPIVLGTQL